MRCVAALLILVASIACGRNACGPDAGGSQPLRDVHPSAESLGRGVLDAFAKRDEAALRRLALTELEFKEHVWPSLPAARPERNLPFEYVWGDLHQKSDNSLRRTLALHGGKRYQLDAVKFAGAPTQYAGFRVHRETVFVVREGTGAPMEVKLCGSMLEKNGAWKVFSYVVED